MRGRVLVFELYRVFELKRGNSSERTTLLLIRRFAPPVPTPCVPAGHFPLIGGICPSRGRLSVVQYAPIPRPGKFQEGVATPSWSVRGLSRGDFVLTSSIPLAPPQSGRSRSLRCSSSPNCVRSAGTQFGSFSFKDAASSSTQKRPRDSSRGRCLHSLINSSACRKSSSSSAASPPTRRRRTGAGGPSAFA